MDNPALYLRLDKEYRVSFNKMCCALLLSFWGSYSYAADLQSTEAVFDKLKTLETTIARLTDELKSTERTNPRILKSRLTHLESSHTQLLHDFTANLFKNEPDAIDAVLADGRLQDYLASEPGRIRGSLNRITSNVVLPESTVSAQEIASQMSRLDMLLMLAGEKHAQLVVNLELSKLVGLDVEQEEKLLNVATLERAENASAYLGVVLGDVKSLKSEAAILPDDQDLQARYRISVKLLSIVVSELQTVTTTLDQLGQVDTTNYRSQILAATGSLSQDIFDIGVLSKLLSKGLDYTLTWFGSNGVEIIFNLITFIVIVVISRFLSRWIKQAVEKGLSLSTAKMSTLLRRMIVSTAASSVYVIGLLIALSQIGFSLGPLLAGLGIAGFVIGFALQDTLSNFASGLMILFYRPFDVGDVIDSGGVFGEVSHMSLVNTTILTFDNQTLIVPNSNIWGNVIKNVTAQRIRRVDFLFGISYGDYIPDAEAVIWEVLNSHELILKDPLPLVKVHELGESSVNIAVRPWVKTADYWTVYWDINRTVKLRFDEEGISIPFPQRDVHIIRKD